jgi:hypothetical protein
LSQPTLDTTIFYSEWLIAQVGLVASMDNSIDIRERMDAQTTAEELNTRSFHSVMILERMDRHALPKDAPASATTRGSLPTQDEAVASQFGSASGFALQLLSYSNRSIIHLVPWIFSAVFKRS